MDALGLSNLAAYSIQIACLALAAILLPVLLRIEAPGFRYGFWRALLVLCLALPWLQARTARPLPGVIVSTEFTTAAAGGAVATPAIDAATVTRTDVLLLVLATGILARLLWIAIGFLRLQRLRAAGEPAAPDDSADLQRRIGTRAEVRYLAEIDQPVTFGLRRPVILLPETLRAQPADIRQAVLAHELVHVRRRDWAWLMSEEIVRAAFWFHPVMWWLISRMQLAREEVVDALAVSLTGRRKAYIAALLAFADGMPLAPAPAFARRRHLFRRMSLVSREDVMTARRLVASATVLILLVALGGWYVVDAFPLSERGAAQVLRMDPGPLEQAAKPITPENPVPRRVHHEPPEYPAEAAAANASLTLTLLLTIDAAGAVAEGRPMGLTLKAEDYSLAFNPSTGFTNGFVRKFDDALEELGKATVRARPGAAPQFIHVTARPIIDATINAAAAAVARWQDAPPANAPVSIATTFFFAPGSPVVDAPAPPPPPPGGIRVGGNVRAPEKLKDVRPVYPQEAQDAGIQGVVIAEITIDESGRVASAHILRSIPLLDQAALDAVRQWQYRPTLLNGAPTPVVMTVTINFSLQ